MLVVKADGTYETFERSKLERSLRRAGAAPDDIAAIAATVERTLTPGMATSAIYRNAFAQLRTREAGTAARYSLKRSILDLGPSGFPFEAYLAEVFRTEGYQAVTNAIGRGKCVEHEIDVLLDKDGRRTYVEAKFHNGPGFKTDLKVVLYVKARIDDIRAREGSSVEGLVVTNTKFTDMAVRYAQCVGLTLLGWDYPSTHSLQARIEASNLYPVTALTTLTNREKVLLLSQKAVLCNGLLRHPEALAPLKIPRARHERLVAEVGALCPT